MHSVQLHWEILIMLECEFSMWSADATIKENQLVLYWNALKPHEFSVSTILYWAYSMLGLQQIQQFSLDKSTADEHKLWTINLSILHFTLETGFSSPKLPDQLVTCFCIWGKAKQTHSPLEIFCVLPVFLIQTFPFFSQNKLYFSFPFLQSL